MDILRLGVKTNMLSFITGEIFLALTALLDRHAPSGFYTLTHALSSIGRENGTEALGQVVFAGTGVI